MDELKRRILTEAVVGEGDIIHVDMFLNHCMDVELLEAAGKKRGFLISGGEVDTERMAKILLDEFRSAKLGRFTLELP